MPIIDASVYVSLANQKDRSHRRCLSWFEACLARHDPMAAPGLLIVEVAASIRRLTASPRLARRVVSELQESELIDLYPLTPVRAESAAEVAAAIGVRGADAVYLALARELGEPLITLDRQQLERGEGIAEVHRPP